MHSKWVWFLASMDMYFSLHAAVFKGGITSMEAHVLSPLYLSIFLCLCVRACVCVCVCACTHVCMYVYVLFWGVGERRLLGPSK